MEKNEAAAGYQTGLAFLRILEYLHEQGNPQQGERSIRVMPKRIKEYLQENFGIAVSRERVRDMLDAICCSEIKDKLVCDSSGKQRIYRYEPEFTLEEVSLLTDMVSSSMFLEKAEIEQLLGKLCALTSFQNYPYLSNADHYYRPPSVNRAALSNLRLIHRAINERVAIRFYSGAIDENKHLYFETADSRHAGQVRRTYPRQPGVRSAHSVMLPKLNDKHGTPKICSPYALVWDNSRCYLICGLHNSDGKTVLWNYRVDRMFNLKIAGEIAYRAPRESCFYDIRNRRVMTEQYLHASFKMFAGEQKPTDVTLKFRTLHTRVIVEKFGYDVTIRRLEDGYASVTVPVQLSRQFYAWLAGFLPEDLCLTAPEPVIAAYREHLRQIMQALPDSKAEQT